MDPYDPLGHPPPAKDDPVVREIPVYLTKQLASGLFLLQYPLRPSERGPEDFCNARVRPNHEIMEIQVGRALK